MNKTKNILIKNLDIIICVFVGTILITNIINNHKYSEIRDEYERVNICGNIDFNMPIFFNAENNQYKVYSDNYNWDIYLSNSINTNTQPKKACTNKWQLVKNTEKFNNKILDSGLTHYHLYIFFVFVYAAFSLIFISLTYIFRI